MQTDTPIAGRSLEESPVVLYDGECRLCNGTVTWILPRDRAGRLRFASLQSPLVAELAGDRELPDSLGLVDADGLHFRSEAVLRIARQLGAPWSWAVVGRLLPRSLRDGLYAWIARNRYRWFGKQEACRLPSPEHRERFLDGE